MAESVVGAFLWCEAVQQNADALPGCLDGSLSGLSKQGFELGISLLDRIEVGGRKNSLAPGGPDGAPDGPSLVTAELSMMTMSPGLSAGTSTRP